MSSCRYTYIVYVSSVNIHHNLFRASRTSNTSFYYQFLITYRNTHHHHLYSLQSNKARGAKACPEIEQMFHPYSISYLIQPLLHEDQSNNISSGRTVARSAVACDATK
eukprot:403404_1